MSWQYTPYIIPIIAVSSVAAVLALIIWRNRHVPEARTLALLMAAVSVWSVIYMLELGATDLSLKVLWARLKYFGIAAAPTAWFVFVIQYSGRHSWLSRRNLALLAIMPLATLLLVWTNDAHYLFWKSVALDESGAFPILSLPVGPALRVCAGYNYSLLLLGIFLLVSSTARSPMLRRRQVAAMIIASLVPLVANFIYSLGLSPVSHLDPTPFAFAITCLVCAWSLLRYRLLNIVPAAQNAVIRSMEDAVIVFDANDCVADLNPSARKIIGSARSDVIGQPSSQALAFWPELARICGEKTEFKTRIALNEEGAERKFDLSVSAIHERSGYQSGRLAILHEITEQANAEKALKESEERYRIFVDQARDIMVTIDLKTGIVTGANSYAARMLGYAIEDVLDKMSFLELVHPDDHESVVLRMQGLAVERTRVPNFPLRLVRADGSLIHVEVNASVVYDADGNPETFIGILRDVSEKRLAEKALQESEKRYRMLVDHSLTGVCLIQDGKYRFANRRALDIVGYTEEELVGMPFTQIVHPDDIELVQGIADRRLSGQDPIAQYQFRCVTKSGDVIWVETFGSPVEYQGNPALMVNLIDITERRRTEEALQLTQLTVDHAPDPVYWMGPDARFVYVNEAACRTLGYSRDELLSMSVPDIHLDFPAGEWSRVWNELRERRSLKFETHHCTKEGRVFPVEITANLLEFMGKEYSCAVVHDISNRKEAEQQIRLSEERYRTLFEESKDCVFITSPEGKFVDVNPAGVETFGYSSEEELLEVDLARDVYANPEDRKIFQKAIERQGFVKDYEMLLKGKDGRELNMLVTANAVRGADGDIVAYRGIMRDITEQKKLEQQLLQAQKMEGIGTLAGGIAHDFNNILGGILGYASFMKTKIDESHPFFNYINTIESGAIRAAELTSQLLAFARGGKYETRPTNLNGIVDETLKLLGRTLDKSIEITSRLHPELPMVMADAGQMHQVLMNLCVNAGDAMPGRGKLVIETGVETLREENFDGRSGAKSGPYVFLSVTDNGVGMDKEIVQRVFEPFFTTKEEGKGSGLGLSMVYGVIKNHGGFVDVYSEPRERTTFKVYLPASGKAEVRISAEADDPAGGDELILVVDDEWPIRELAREILEFHGYRVLLAADGVEALEMCRKRNGEIDLLILDMVMPKMGGREAFLRIKEISPDIKALLSTGYSKNGKAQEILDSGVMGFVQKPYQATTLLAAVRTVLDSKTRV